MKKITKIIKIIIFSLFLVMGQQVMASMSSNNYTVWIDTLSSGGGGITSTNYSINSNISSQVNQPGSSTNFSEKSGFSAIDDEPTVGFTITSATLNFGELSASSTSYSSNTFFAYTNSIAGYSIKVYGSPLNNTNHTLSAIGSTPAASSIGTEQFGLNLVANTVPVIGQNPSGGSGQAVTNYDTANSFAYTSGDAIAEAANFSFQTEFTVSMIVNIAKETPAGTYDTVLTYEFIPVF